MAKKQIPIDDLISIGGSIISDKPPKTFFGRVMRVIKRLIAVKDSANIKINKRP